ncbi:MAG: hypothetical protein WCU00_08780 [Candidatus Latescibacterota bacterium]
MYTWLSLFFSLFLIFCPVSEAFSADITWKVYLKQYPTEPLLTVDTREGEDFTIPVRSYTSDAQKLMDALAGTRFVIEQTPVSRSLEIRIILNNQGSVFQKPRSNVPVFLNITVDAYVNGSKETSLRFLSNSPLVITIPSSGVDALLQLSDGDLKRGDDLLLAYVVGTRFSNEGITTSNTTSGITSYISHTSSIVGSTYELLNLQSPTKISTWGKIKILFQ